VRLTCSRPSEATWSSSSPRRLKKDAAGERVAGLALVEDAVGAALLLGIVKPVEHEQGAICPPDLTQRAGNRALTRKPASLRGMAEAARRSVPPQFSSTERMLTEPGDEQAQGRPAIKRCQTVRSAFVEILDTRREAEAGRAAQTKT